MLVLRKIGLVLADWFWAPFIRCPRCGCRLWEAIAPNIQYCKNGHGQFYSDGRPAQ